MIKLFDNDNDQVLGSITEEQLDFLQEQLIEETVEASSYNLSESIIDSLEMNGAEPEVVALLRKALGGRTSMEVRYEPD